MKSLNHPCLLLEYIDGTTLNDIDNIELSINDKIKIVFQIMIILEYLHSKEYIYRDLKPDNIVINSNKTAFLLDFNKMIKTPKTKEEVTFSIASDYTAPEILNGYYYTNKVDIFSLGLIVEHIFSNEIHTLNLNIIINKCTNDDPDARPTIFELKELFYTEYFSTITPVQVDKSIKIENEEQYFTYWFLISEYSNPEAQYQLGLIYENGLYLPKDINKAIQFYDQSVKSNHVKSLLNLGNIYFFDNEYIYYKLKGFNYLQIAADLKNPDAQYKVGLIYLTGSQHIQPGKQKGWEYLINAAKQNQLDAIHYMGTLYLSSKDIDKAIYFFERGANQNVPESQHMLGEIYSNEKYTKVDIKKALYYFQLASDQGFAFSQFSIGQIYYEGVYVERNMEKAIYYFKLSADGNNVFAQWILFNIYYHGKYNPKNIELSLHYLEQAANNNHPMAQFTIGSFFLLNIHLPTNLEKAFYYLSLAANKNHFVAQKYLGLLFLRDDFDQCDINKAIYYLTLAANNNNDKDAQYHLGKIFSDGKKVEPDMKKAVHYLTLSANQNFMPAMSELGNILYEGKGVERNIVKGIYYLNCAAKFNHPVAQYNLANVYLIGDFIPRDVNKAIYYFSLSADQNYASSQRALGLIYLGVTYLEGIFVPRDYKKSIYFFKNASSFNDEFSKNNLAIIYNNVINNVSFAIELLKEAINQKNDHLSMYNLAHIYFYDEQLKVNIDNIIELLIKSLRISFNPSFILLSLVLIKKFPHHGIDEIKSELIRYGVQSSKIIDLILLVIHDNNLNVEECYNILFEIVKNEVYIYSYAYDEVSFAKITSIDFEKLQEANAEKIIIKDINEVFYEGFYSKNNQNE